MTAVWIEKFALTVFDGKFQNERFVLWRVGVRGLDGEFTMAVFDGADRSGK